VTSISADPAVAEQMAADKQLVDSVDVIGDYENYLRSSTAPNPYPIYKQYRDNDPVHEGDVLHSEFGLAPSMASSGGTRPVYSIFRYDDVLAVLTDPSTFSNTLYQETLGQTYAGKNLVMVDPPEHAHYRNGVQGAFTRKRIEHWRDSVVLPTVNEYVQSIKPLGRADLLRDMAMGYPVDVIHRMLGLPNEERDRFWKLGVGLLAYSYMPDVAMACSRQISSMLRDIIAERKVTPGEDMVSIFLEARDRSGDSLADDEVLSFLNILIPAGGETTMRALGALAVGLLSDREQLNLVLDDPKSMAAAVEEALRWEAPANVCYRITLKDVELSGVKIPAGSGINAFLGSGNRDETVFPDPDRFELRRDRRAGSSNMLTLAWGTHVCLGMAPAPCWFSQWKGCSVNCRTCGSTLISRHCSSSARPSAT
jgi:cytochrome P450